MVQRGSHTSTPARPLLTAVPFFSAMEPETTRRFARLRAMEQAGASFLPRCSQRWQPHQDSGDVCGQDSAPKSPF